MRFPCPGGSQPEHSLHLFSLLDWCWSMSATHRLPDPVLTRKFMLKTRECMLAGHTSAWPSTNVWTSVTLLFHCSSLSWWLSRKNAAYEYPGVSNISSLYHRLAVSHGGPVLQQNSNLRMLRSAREVKGPSLSVYPCVFHFRRAFCFPKLAIIRTHFLLLQLPFNQYDTLH